MQKLVLLPLLLLITESIAQVPKSSTPVSSTDPVKLVKESLIAYGGESWDKINFINPHYYSHNYLLEQSESPEGPFITVYDDVLEIRSLKELKLYQKKEARYVQTIHPDTSELIVNHDFGMMKNGFMKTHFQPMSGFMDRSKSWMLYCPIKLLQTISGAALTYKGKTTLSGVPHCEVGFSSKELTGKILINLNTMLVSEAYFDSYWPHEYYFSIWGKFQTRVQYSLYLLHSGNRLYPHQWNISHNGQPWQQITINQIQFLESTDESIFNIPDDIKAKIKPLVNANDLKPAFDRIKEIAPGIKLSQGAWNTGWVEQENGIVIVEAPISSGYSKSVVQEVKKRFPDKPIKGVIVTSDAWPHLGGAREYMAESIPIYTSYLNKGILNKLAQADYSIRPDSYQKKKNKPVINWIQTPVTINDKNIPLTIYPVNGEGGERMAIVYFSKQKLLYATDLIQYLDPAKKIFFFPEYLNEVRELVEKNNLDVEIVYAMHMAPTPWKEVVDFLDKLK